MKSKLTEEFKIHAVKQINEESYTVSSVSERIGVSSNSLYNWLKPYRENSEQYLKATVFSPTSPKK